MGLGQAVGQTVAAGITTAGNITTNAVTNAMNRKIAKETNETSIQIARENNANQERLQDKQNAWNLEQWQRENEYNSPAAQMERYVAAGMNPVWTMGDSSQGNAAHLESAGVGAMSMPTLNLPTMQAPNIAGDIAELLGAFSNWTKTKAEIPKIEADKAETEARTASILQKTPVEIANMLKSGALIDEETNLRIAQTESEEERKKLIAVEIDATNEAINKTKMEITTMLGNLINNIRQLDIEQQNANIAGYNAVTNRMNAQTSARAQNLAEKKYKETELPMFHVEYKLKQGEIAIQNIDKILKENEANGVNLGVFGRWNLSGLNTQLDKLQDSISGIPYRLVMMTANATQETLFETSKEMVREVGNLFSDTYEIMQKGLFMMMMGTQQGSNMIENDRFGQ